MVRARLSVVRGRRVAAHPSELVDVREDIRLQLLEDDGNHMCDRQPGCEQRDSHS